MQDLSQITIDLTSIQKLQVTNKHQEATTILLPDLINSRIFVQDDLHSTQRTAIVRLRKIDQIHHREKKTATSISDRVPKQTEGEVKREAAEDPT